MAKKSGKKKRTQPVDEGTGEGSGPGVGKVSKSLVIRRGKTAVEVSELVTDMRHMMMPFTALNFQEDAQNRKLTLQQYSKHVALPMGISHMMAFSQNESRLNLRLGRTPEGPTLHFRVQNFSLSRHIKSLQKRPVSNTTGIQANPPVVVTNNFGDSSNARNQAALAAPHIKLMRITFQNLFPAINVAAVKLGECRRVVLFNLMPSEDEEDGAPMVEMRHYAIQASVVGVHKRVKKLVASSKRKLPNLHKVQDIADYVTGQSISGGASVTSDAAPSDSEAEDDPRHTIELPDSYMGQRKAQKSALKLVELGPRLTLSLVKVEKGLGQGDVLYHSHVQKSPEEAAALKAKKQKEASLKDDRKATQEANVQRKRKVLDDKRESKRNKKEEKQEALMQDLRQPGDDALSESEEEASESEASDVES
mmetsp:Transcript_2308/g.3164  ORF Transcript_2308/g.3164 Transcript_2308/m.3164 type:complete len:421 (+) Transcript_2308:28-1290(+)